MTDFYRIKFSVTARDEYASDFIQELIGSIQKWLIGKYGLPIVDGIVSDWSTFYTGGIFGDQDRVGRFYVESASYTDHTDISNKSWACRIIEFPKYNLKYIPRRWITEIGYQSNSKKKSEVSYSVKYDDLSGYKGKPQYKPGFNIPNVAKSILSSDRWTCSIDGNTVTTDTMRYAAFTGTLFGIDDCRALIRPSINLPEEIEEPLIMVDTEVAFTSLCYIAEDYDGRVWLYRLADIEDDRLHAPFKSGRMDNYFENRDRLYRNDGPSTIGSVGVWDWTAIPNRDNPAIDYVQSYYVKDYSPIRVVVLTAKSLDDTVEQLKNGTARTQPYFCDTFFCYEPKSGQLTGVLCCADEFKISDRFAKLSETVYSLPIHTISLNDVFNWDDRNLRFLKELQMGTPSGHISIGNTDEIIRTLILERTTWPLFKECIGATKAEWRNSKILLERICGESLYEAVVSKLKCTPDQAKQAVDDFVKRAGILIEAGDIDADILTQIAMHHDGLRNLCEETISLRWEKIHATEIAAAKAEVAEVKSKAELEIKAAKQLLSDIEQATSTAEVKRSELLGEIATAQSKLDQLLAEIDQYEALGKGTLEAVRQKIADAQKDMAGFIADLSVFLPQTNAASAVGSRIPLWKYACATEGLYSDDDIELAKNWDDEINAISQNLAHSLSVPTDFCAMLTAFLYSAHINNVPILIAGPGGHDIAEVLSVSMYAAGAGQLTLGNECDYDIADGISGCNEQIVSIQNMFGKGWADELPQTFTRLNSQIIWTHPYVEDMAIEPKGLYNYMLPILSECFVGSIPALDPWPGKRAENFKVYTSKKKLPLRISAFKRLGLSKLLMAKLELILSDAKAIMDNAAKDKDMEVLFGLLPLCVLTGKLDILKDVVETESGISNAVKAEAARYIEEE